MPDFRVTATVSVESFPDNGKVAKQVPAFRIENTTKADAEKMAMEIINPTGNVFLKVNLSVEEIG